MSSLLIVLLVMIACSIGLAALLKIAFKYGDVVITRIIKKSNAINGGKHKK
ncbi:MAG: hypothetical protein ACFFCS_03515 [Candidatus Hodarchaeota archaeon]